MEGCGESATDRRSGTYDRESCVIDECLGVFKGSGAVQETARHSLGQVIGETAHDLG